MADRGKVFQGAEGMSAVTDYSRLFEIEDELEEVTP